MLRRKSQCKDYDPEQYLRDADNRFSFDPESGIYKPKPCNKEKKGKKFKILSLSLFQWGTLLLSGLTLIFLIRYTNYARLQWCAMEKAAEAAKQSAIEAKNANLQNRDAVIKIQRAFALMNNVPVIESVGANRDRVQFMFHWENSGATPTKFFDSRINALLQKEPISPTYTFPDVPTKYATSDDIGPKGTFYTGTESIPAREVQEVILSQKHLYFYGWARYNDVFEGTPRHVTKFCLEVLPAIPNNVQPSGQPGILTATGGYVQIGSCKTHNCYDEECKEK